MNPMQFFEYGKNRGVKKFVSTWDTRNISSGSSASNQIRLPLFSTGDYAMTVKWGDGTESTVSDYQDASATHTYSVEGVYTIEIVGTCENFRFGNGGDKLKILSVTTWGQFRLGNNTESFYGCTNLDLRNVSDVLDITNVNDLTQTFAAYAFSFINRINEWDFSNITNISSFLSGSNYNSDIDFNTIICSVFSGMLQSAKSMNSSVTLKTQNATYINSMFYGSTNFNGALNFNDTSKVISASFMFRDANNFNKPLNWNMPALQDSSQMFFRAYAFNQDLNNWGILALTNAYRMFYQANAFNQPLDVWDIRNVTSFAQFMFGKSSAQYSSANYDATLIAWASRPVKPNIGSVEFGNIKYSSAATNARNILTGAPNNWVISDGGLI